jgi:hypothetical protein
MNHSQNEKLKLTIITEKPKPQPRSQDIFNNLDDNMNQQYETNTNHIKHYKIPN